MEQKPGKNKPDKIPYQITGARASPNNQGHFKSLAEIEAVFKKGGYDAIDIGVFYSIVVTLMESVLLVCGDYGTTVRPETISA